MTTSAVNGTATVNAAGLTTYTPNAGFAGTDSFVVTVTDQGGLAGLVTVSVTATVTRQITGHVTDANAAPVAGAAVNISVAGTNVPQITTNASGVYTATIPIGTASITVSKAGFNNATATFSLTANGPTVVPLIPLTPVAATTGGATGVVKDATNNTGIVGATVNLRLGINAPANSPVIATATSDATGNYTFAAIAAGTYTATTTKAGFADSSITVTIQGGATTAANPVLMSPVLAAGQTRIVLSWGATPSDLDSHLRGPLVNGGLFHVFFGNNGSTTVSPFAQLNIDVTSGFGPETITISQTTPGTYHYFVRNFSRNPAITTSSAVVKIFQGAAQVGAFNVPVTGVGRDWHVFDIDGQTGTIIPINSILDASTIPIELVVSPSPLTLPLGHVSQLAASLVALDSSTLATPFSGTWVSATPTVATVISATGLVTPVAIGTSIVTATDTPSGFSATSVITVVANAVPALVNNTGFTVPVGVATAIPNTALQVTDADNTPAQLVYTVTALPAVGTLKKGGVALVANGTFTQADIDAGNVTYLSNAGAGAGATSFSFTVTDGSGGSVAATTFSLNTNHPPAPTAIPASVTITALAAAITQVNHGDPDVGDTLTYSISTQPVNGTATVTTTGLVTYTPTTGVADSLVVTVTDQGGLTGTVTIQVVDQSPPAINAHSPLAGATGVMVNSPISVTFSEPMNTATITTNSFQVAVSNGVAVAGTISFDATGTVATFVPTGNLLANNNYTVTLTTTSMTDIAGNAIATVSPTTFSFTTGSNMVTLPPVLPVVQGPVTNLGNYDGFSMLWNGVANGANKANRWSGVLTTPNSTITGLASFLDGAVVPTVAGGLLPTKIGANRIIQLGALNSGDNLAASVSLDGQFIAATNLDLNLATVEEMLFVKQRVPVHTAASVAGLYNMVEFVRTPGAVVNITATSHGVLTINANGTWSYASVRTALTAPQTGGIGAPFAINDNGTFVIDVNGAGVTTSAVNPNMTLRTLVSADGNYIVIFRMDTVTRESAVMIGVRQHTTTMNVANLTVTSIRFAPSEVAPLSAMRGEVGIEGSDANGLLNSTHGSVIDNGVVCGVGTPPLQPNCQFLVDPATTVTAGANGAITLTDTTNATFSGFTSINGNVFLIEEPGKAISIAIKQ
ncbi:MAG: cadherin-like domain-containing protein [Mariprofundus sp.]